MGREKYSARLRISCSVLSESNPGIFRRCTLFLAGNAGPAGSGGGVDTALNVFVLIA